MKDVTWGQYIPGQSILHLLDPRSKLLSAFILTLSLYGLPSLIYYGIFLIFLIVLHHVAGFPASHILKDLRKVWLLLFFTFLLRLISTPGEPLQFASIILPGTREGLELAALMSSRIALMISTASFLSRLASPKSLADGLTQAFSFLQCFHVPMEEIGLIAMLAFRFIPSLQKESRDLMEAQKSRGVNFQEGNFIQRSRTMLGLVFPLFFSLLRRSDVLATAMTLRGYTGNNQARSQHHPLRYNKQDRLLYLFCLLFALAIVLIRVVWLH